MKASEQLGGMGCGAIEMQQVYLNVDGLDKFPQVLKDIPQWIVWRVGKQKPDGKFDKLPKGKDGTGQAWQVPAQWMSYDEALTRAQHDGYAGIGFVLPAQTADGSSVVALDFDGVYPEEGSPRLSELKPVWCDVGKPYCEVSPSGKGLRMFVLSEDKIKQVSVANPHGGMDEIFCGSPKWVTVTGNHLIGSGCPDASASALFRDRPMPKQATRPKTAPPWAPNPTGQVSLLPKLEHTPRNVARVAELLTTISADCSYDTYRAVIWALESIGWGGIEDLQRGWSLTAPHRFKEQTLQTLKRDYQLSEKSIGFGTLVFLARNAEVVA
jgi:hypothetical protein